MGKIILNGTGYGGSGGSGGHTIVDPNGTDMPQENKLQFTGAVNVSDDSANGQTVVNVEGGVIYLPTIYSDEEREVGVWRDGKPLYQRTYTALNVTVNSWQDISHDISNIGYRQIVGSFIRNSDGLEFPIPYYESASAFIAAQINTSTIEYKVNGITTGTLSITIQYTKTTDVAGSGSWTPSGANAVHYSTNEQAIGTYLGKALYEKVYVNNGSDITANSGNWTTICSETWVQNVKQIVNSLFSRQAYSASSTGIFTPCEFMAENGAIKINPFRNLTFKSGAYFVIQYTKD